MVEAKLNWTVADLAILMDSPLVLILKNRRKTNIMIRTRCGSIFKTVLNQPHNAFSFYIGSSAPFATPHYVTMTEWYVIIIFIIHD